jgi:hypothetical protein
VTSPVARARLAGLVGLVVLASGTFATSVGSKLVVRDDVATTAENLVGSPFLFRLGITSALVMMVAYLFYSLMLYELLHSVRPSHARAMLALVVASVPVFMLNQVNQFAMLLSASSQRLDRLELFLELGRLGSLIGAVFFGLWLLPLGLLVFRSGFLPRALGILLVCGSPGYVVLFVQGFLFPGSERTLWTNPFLVATHMAEAALLLWLLIRGVDVSALQRDRQIAA